MRVIPKEQVLRRIKAENTWWDPPHTIGESYSPLPPRAYLELLYPLISNLTVRRAVLLMGPRRVGKTVMIHHTIAKLIASGVEPSRILYVSVDHPIYNGCGLQDLLESFQDASNAQLIEGQFFVFFDEIQYLRDWEVHLKVLVDSYRNIKFIASGSAAAALRLKSTESGAGRFTDFLLPPVTFFEYLTLLKKQDLVDISDPDDFKAVDIAALNESFVHYLNFGGYPEVVFSETIQADPARFIKSDIVDKVLLRDLPGLYGIQDIQELNYLFTTLAFNSANEVSLEQLSQHSGVAKNTIKRYIEYLEAAFLVKVVHRVSRNAKRFQRANFFKIYLTNPSIRSALFSPIASDDEGIGSVVETGIFAQWFHSPFELHYARWDQGEVDIVSLTSLQKPNWALEVKWSDRYVDRPSELKSVVSFCHANDLDHATVTTRSQACDRTVEDVRLKFVPASVYCYMVGHNLLKGWHIWSDALRRPPRSKPARP